MSERIVLLAFWLTFMAAVVQAQTVADVRLTDSVDGQKLVLDGAGAHTEFFVPVSIRIVEELMAATGGTASRQRVMTAFALPSRQFARLSAATAPLASGVFGDASLVDPSAERGAAPCIRDERIKEAKAAIDRVKAEAAKGAKANFDPRDNRLVAAFRMAKAAEGLYLSSRSPTPQNAGIKRELLLKANEAAERVVVEFNEHAADASLADADTNLLRGFANAVLAVDCIRKAASSAGTTRMKPGQVQAIREAGQRVLDEFNRNASGALFRSDDLSTLQAFHDAFNK